MVGRRSLCGDELEIIVSRLWVGVRLYHMGRGACIKWALSLSMYNSHLTDQSLLMMQNLGFF